MNAERLLVFLLRLVGASAVLAIVPVFMPHLWMDQVHRHLGLGELPELPMTVYLSRSLSAFYVFHGVMMWLLAGDLKRYAPLVTYLGLAFIGFGCVTITIDLRAQLPWFWTVGEPVFAIGFGLAILWLQRLSRESAAS